MPGVVRYGGGAFRGPGKKRVDVREDAGSVSLPAEALRSVEETHFDESFSERREVGFYYPRIGDGREILEGVFQFMRDAPRVLAPWRLAGFYRYYRNLGSEVESSDVVFPSDGMSISGVLCRPKKEGKLPTIVLSVGINAKAREMLPLVEGLAKQGYNVFAPDSRTSMSSEPGEDLARGDIADLLNAVKFLHEQSWFDGSYVLLGVSIGGARSLIAAGRMAKTPEFTGVDAKYKYPKAVVSLGGYASMEDEFNYLRWLVELKGEKPELKVKLPEFAEKWVAWVSEKAARDGLTAEQVSREFWERSPLKFVGDIPASCPLFIGHGFDDRVIPSGDARRLAEMRPENTVLRRDVGGGIHTVIDVLTDVNPYRLRPVKFGRKFVSDLVTGHKTPAEATWYLIDDLKDVVGLGLTAYELDRFLRKSLPKSSE